MILIRLDIHQCRVINQTSLTFSQGLNLITGANASGKTSLLEAIYLLFTGRSFRTSRVAQLIQTGHPQLQLVGVYRDVAGLQHILGLERQTKTAKLHLDGEAYTAHSKLPHLVPVHVINPETHYLLEQGPKFRRQFLDWGVFHVEHDYLALWHNYHRVLRQRNTLLRQKVQASQVKAWDKPLLEQAMLLHAARERYFQALQPQFSALAEVLLDETASIHYSAGWPEPSNLLDVMNQTYESDRERGYTQYGCQRADLLISSANRQGANNYSRGQQKLLVSALRLAHLQVLKQCNHEPGILLVDDLPSELDKERRLRLLKCLADAKTQTFITATDPELLDISSWPENKMFHVERGAFHEVL